MITLNTNSREDSQEVERLAQLAGQAKLRDLQRESRNGWRVSFENGVAHPTRAGKSIRTNRTHFVAVSTSPRSLPGIQHLQARTSAAAIEANLKGVDPSLGALLQTAMEHYMKGLIEECVALSGSSYKRRGRFRYDFKLRNRVGPGRDGPEPTIQHNVIGVRHLETVAAMHPRLLGAHPEVSKAKISHRRI